MDKIDYDQTKKYWNNLKSRGQYSMGYHMENEDLARYRFKKELIFLRSNCDFYGNYLDLGCGTGNFLYEFQNYFQNLIGIDFSDLLIECAKEKCKGINKIKIYNDNVLNFSEYIKNTNGLDFIFIGGVFAYLESKDVEKIVNELWQVLNEGGYLVLREPTISQKTIFEDINGYLAWRREPKEYISLFSKLKYKKIIVKDNYSATYVGAILKYQKLFPFLEKLPIGFWGNKIIEFLLLFLPANLLKKLRSNMYTYHFIIIKK